MAEPGQELEGPGGVRLRFVAVAPERLVMEASYAGPAPLPPAHLHPRQDEAFTVLAGTFRVIVDGVEARYGPGEAFTVPAGTPHQMAAESAARLRWEVRPALRTAAFFERLYGPPEGRPHDAESGARFLAEFADELRLT